MKEQHVLLPKHILRDRDRHGNARYYYRKPGQRMVRLRAAPGTPEFMAEYQAALAGKKLRPPRRSFLYFFQVGRKYIKIGYSSCPSSRLRDLQIGSSKKITWLYSTPGGAELEAELHDKFAHLLVRGEWFIFGREIRAWIEADERRRRAEAKGERRTPTVAPEAP